ncbi:MAG: M48 family metalloprotease [Leptolyngbya sp.]|nr:M48 family metalloprotease [Leptolyngbya sp.]
MAESSGPQPLPPASGDPSAPAQNDPVAHRYRQGEAAFKQGQYTVALGHFLQLVSLAEANSAMQLKGRMGLILTQQKLGQTAQARQECRRMLASDIPEARRWAEAWLAKLPEIPTDQGFAPTPSAPPSPPPATDAATFDPTGFVPLDAPPNPPSPPGKLSQGKSLPLPAPREASSGNADLNSTEVESPQGRAAATRAAAEPMVTVPITPQSLFHYQHLNQETREISLPAGSPQPDSPPAPSPGPSPAPALSPETSEPSPPQETTPHPLPQRPAPTAPQRRLPMRPFPQPYELWFAQAMTLGAVLWVAIMGIHRVFGSANDLLRQVTWPVRLGGFSWLDRPYTIPILLLWLGLFLASPWWMDGLLARVYGQRTLSTRQLQGQHPTALTLLRQQCQRQGWYLPELRVLPDPVPLCFSYGWRPRYLRLVVSQGLLDNANDEVLGIFLTYELAHMINGATAVLSGFGGLLLILSLGYQQITRWADQPIPWLIQVVLKGLAQGIYGLFWVLRRGLLWLSRLRSQWADHRVEAMVQRPDLQQSALLWLSHQLPIHLRQRDTLSPPWWSLDVLMPLSPHAALSPGSFMAPLGEATPLLNDWANPYRQWLMGGATHKPLGDRLRWLNQRAGQRQQPTLALTEPSTPLAAFSLSRLMRQKGPIIGGLVGGGLALVFWFVGGLVMRFGWQRLSWWYQDESLLYGGVLLGLGIGLLIRINALYPDIPSTQPMVSDPNQIMGAVSQLPVEGEPCRLSGTLIEAPESAPGQTVYLATLDGFVRLGFSSPQPWIWDLKPSPSPLRQWVGRSVSVSGWRRRNDGLLWVDVATLSSASQRPIASITAPLWATLISLGLCFSGIYTIWTGA